MKKILFTLMLLLCATAVMAEDETGFIDVYNAQELQDAVKSNLSADGKTSYAKIKLKADIYLSELPNKGKGTLNNTFSGTIYGTYWEYDQEEGMEVQKSHIIYGGHDNELGTDSLRDCEYLFTYLRGATFEGIIFKFIRVASEDNNYQGVIASQAWDSHFKFVVVDKCYVFCNKDYAGSFVGHAENCTFETVSSIGTDVRVYGVGAGGLVGYSSKSQYITSTTLRASSAWADGSNAKNHAWSGGFVGYSVGDKFNSCMNTALVGGDQNQVGGFVGESSNSDFYNCKNYGMTVHTGESDFNDHCKEERARFRSLSEDHQRKFGNVCLGLAYSGTALWYLYLEAGAKIAHVISQLSFTLVNPVMTAVAIGILVATVITVVVLEGDDEIGGICGLANGGTFDRCSNFAYTKCKDENGGGIVGLGYGVTINNCYNGGRFEYDEDDKGGSIIGSALTGENGKKSKVTNCCAYVAYHLIGDTGGLDSSSGNNYRLSDNGETESTWCETSVDSATMKSGLVALWLNQSSENRELKPWRQKLTCDPTNPNDTIIDLVPCLDIDHPVVTIEDLGYTEISNADELIAFSETVNSGKQFSRAVLTRDINMAGKPWTPIGKNESNKHFRGLFDGRGHKITGLTCTSDKAVGLFGAVHTGAEIRNVIIGEDCTFTCNGYEGAGSIVGRVAMRWDWGNVLIENCGSYANVNGKKYIGGILGLVTTGEDGHGVKVYINNCFSHGIITVYDGNSGLIAGHMHNNGYVSNCWSNAYLRRSEGRSTWPYGCENDINECFVGYESNLNISNCFITDPDTHIDRYTEYKLQSGVTVVSSDELALGKVTFELNKSNAEKNKELIWQQNLSTDGSPSFGNKGLYHTRKVSNQYGTACFPFAVKSDDKISCYRLARTDDDGQEVTMTFAYTEKEEAGKPVLFRVADAEDVNADNPVEICFSNAGDKFVSDALGYSNVSFDFLGTFKQKVYEGDKRIYYVSDGKIRNSKKTTIPPFRAYFSGPSIDDLIGGGANQAKAIKFVLEDEFGETTALEFVGDDLVPVQQSGKSYSVMGTEVGEGYRGLVIRNGKKVIQNR